MTIFYTDDRALYFRVSTQEFLLVAQFLEIFCSRDSIVFNTVYVVMVIDSFHLCVLQTIAS